VVVKKALTAAYSGLQQLREGCTVDEFNDFLSSILHLIDELRFSGSDVQRARKQRASSKRTRKLKPKPRSSLKTSAKKSTEHRSYDDRSFSSSRDSDTQNDSEIAKKSTEHSSYDDKSNLSSSSEVDLTTPRRS
jgi:hypothetical protein